MFFFLLAFKFGTIPPFQPMPTFAPFGELPNWQSLPPWATNMPVIGERIEEKDNAAKNDQALYFLIIMLSFLYSCLNE